MKGRDLLSLSFRVIGLIFALTGVVVAVTTGVFVTRAERVTGEVVDYATEQNAIAFMRSDEPTGILYYPVVEYSLPGGGSYTITGRTGRSARAFEVGDRVGVLVATDNPERARLDTVFEVWGTSIILGGLGVLFLVLSVFASFGFGGVRRS